MPLCLYNRCFSGVVGKNRKVGELVLDSGQVPKMLEMGNAGKPGNMQLNCTSENYFPSIPPVSP